MKPLLLTICIVYSAFESLATIRTVSNTPATLAQFNTIQAAINVSTSGDTIYVHGSPNIYASFIITNKQLVIIGPGWRPNKNLPLTAVVDGFTIAGVASSNTELQGLIINLHIYVNVSPAPANLRFIRNQFNPVFLNFGTNAEIYSGYLFEGNFFNSCAFIGSPTGTYQNFIFQNNVIWGGQGSGFNNLANCINVLFNNNLWYAAAPGPTDCFTGNNGFLTFTNNIFVGRNAATGNSNSSFTNNITFNAGNNTPWAFNGNIDGGGNITNQDPQMVAQVAVNAGTNNPLLNFTIAAGPANNSGSEGKDMGLLYDAVGSLNWATSRTSRLPYIYSMQIVNPNVATGGNLTVIIEARKNN